jgi:hypothetical protein
MDQTTAWTDDDWAAWRANNVRLMKEGWSLGTDIMLDGTVVSWAEKDGIRIRRDPNWERGPNGEYIYGRP